MLGHYRKRIREEVEAYLRAPTEDHAEEIYRWLLEYLYEVEDEEEKAYRSHPSVEDIP
jgi:hypothetical protein